MCFRPELKVADSIQVSSLARTAGVYNILYNTERAITPACSLYVMAYVRRWLISSSVRLRVYVVFHGYCVMICTGWRFHSGCSTSWSCLFIGIFGTELQCTSPTAACQSPKFPAANISVRPAVANWIFRGFVAIRCTDTSDLRHFGPKTFRHWCRYVHETLRHQCRNVLDT